ncbi:MAG: TIGR02217 family protein [Hyphomicrobiaceae bacterium]
MGFHEIRFPPHVSLGATGGPERRTDVVVMGSGFEERNARWAHARRSYNAGYGIRSLDDLHDVIAFFEERRGRLFGFRWKDHADFRSCPPEQMPSAADQLLGVGDGENESFAITKRYGSFHAPYLRPISKPVAGSVMVSVAGVTATEGVDFDIDATTGYVVFRAGKAPESGAGVTAGFEFDVPVRFDSDRLDISLSGFRHGAIPTIPIIEIRIR